MADLVSYNALTVNLWLLATRSSRLRVSFCWLLVVWHVGTRGGVVDAIGDDFYRDEQHAENQANRQRAVGRQADRRCGKLNKKQKPRGVDLADDGCGEIASHTGKGDNNEIQPDDDALATKS